MDTLLPTKRISLQEDSGLRRDLSLRNIRTDWGLSELTIDAAEFGQFWTGSLGVPLGRCLSSFSWGRVAALENEYK
jgi:hypothetical protein